MASPAFQVSVKWGKELFPLEFNPVEGVDLLRAQLFALTSVPQDRQKILFKGKMIKESADLLKLRSGDTLNLIGTADVMADAPAKPVLFEEDLTDAQRAKTELALPSGLHNLGNTCYLNSSLQCMRSFPELKDALEQYKASRSGARDGAHLLTEAMHALFGELNASTSERPVTPYFVVAQVRQLFPQFNETNDKGQHSQQDADECYSQLMLMLLSKLKDIRITVAGTTFQDRFESLFEGQLAQEIKCLDSDVIPATHKLETFRRLQCHITINTNHLHEGIKASFETTFEKRVPELGGDARFSSQSVISALPFYLTVQFVRFDWKKGNNKKAKIMRKVVFPLELDVHEFCGVDLKNALTTNRVAKLAADDRALGLVKAGDGMEIVEEKNDVALLAGKGTGRYELVGVVTHQGRDSDGGHYVGWAKSAQKWNKFDDSVVSEVTEDEVKALSGGGDWPMAYLLFYRHILV